jgi:hypothetical protein
MTINCDRIDDLLFEGDDASLALAEAHAAHCPSCGPKLADWNDITATAQAMHERWENATLWPRIKRSIVEDRRPRLSFETWRIAAAIVVMIAIGASVWYALRVRSSRDKAFDQAIIRVNALDDVERAEKAHVAAIDKLEKVAGPRLEEPQTPLLVSYKEKLMLLDDAIAECQSNIDNNQQNAHLRKQLLTMYTEKQRTLQDVLREGEGNHASNP